MLKTGGTFVTSVLKRIHQPEQRHEPSNHFARIARRFLKGVRYLAKSLPAKPKSRYGSLVDLEPKHGTCHNIPEPHRNKTILSNMRNPYDWFFYKDSEAIITRIDKEYLASGRHREDMFEVHFVKTNRLNQELFDFLLSIVYDANDLEFFSGLNRILPMGKGRRDDQKWESYYAPELKAFIAFIREKDYALFNIFPDFDV